MNPYRPSLSCQSVFHWYTSFERGASPRALSGFAASKPPGRMHGEQIVGTQKDHLAGISFGGAKRRNTLEGRERDQAGAAFMPQGPRQSCSALATCSGPRSGQLHAGPCVAEAGGALVADAPAGNAGEDRSTGGQTRAICYVPTGQGRGAAKPAAQISAAGQ